jgi:hypothetical protein
MRPTGSTASSNEPTPTLFGRQDRCRSKGGGHHTVVGEYTLDTRVPTPRYFKSRLPCPYCEGPMVGATGDGMNRVVRACSGGAVCDLVVASVPASFAVLGCKACQQRFTTPLELAQDVDAVDPQADSTGKPTTRV